MTASKFETEELLREAIKPKWGRAFRLAELYLIAFIGGWLASLIHAPASWLTGSLLSVSAAMFLGRSLALPNLLRDLGFAAVGIILGTGFSPKTVEAIATWPFSVAMLCVAVIAITWASYAVLRRFGGWDHSSALFASIPGALAYVMAVAEASKADMQKVTVAQAIRLFALLAFLPIALAPFTGNEPQPVMQEAGQASTLGWSSVGLLVLLTGLLVPIFLRLKIPAAQLLAGMTVSGSFYLSGTYVAPISEIATIPVFVTIGAMVGCRFGAISPATLLCLSKVSLLSLLAALTVSIAFAWVVAQVWDFPVGQVVLAFSPGGFEVMVLLSFMFDLNPAYVAGHHLVRYFGLVILAPIVTARLTRTKK